MTMPDWTEAPTEATHYDCNADVFCTVDGWWSCAGEYYQMPYQMAWGGNRYTPRPVAQSDRTQLVTALNQLRNETDLGIVADVILSIGFRLER